MELRCYFCGESVSLAIFEEHYIVPRSIAEKMGIDSDETIVVCVNCHRKLHYIYGILFKKLGIPFNVDDERRLERMVEDEIMRRLYEEEKYMRKLYDNLLEIMPKRGCLDIEVVVGEMVRRGFKEEDVREFIHKLMEEGEIFMPKENCIMLSKYIVY